MGPENRNPFMGIDGKIPLWDLNSQNTNTNLSLYIKRLKHIPLHTGTRKIAKFLATFAETIIYNINLFTNRISSSDKISIMTCEFIPDNHRNPDITIRININNIYQVT